MRKRLVITGIIIFACLIAFAVITTRHHFRTRQHSATMGIEKGKGRWGVRSENIGNLSTEQWKQIEKLQKNFRDDNAESIKQLMTKRFDLNTILDSDKPDADKAKAMQKQISDLNSNLAQKEIDLYLELRKINPDAKYGRGSVRDLGMMGMQNGFSLRGNDSY